ncbi:unnamed protein product [Prorocentrum cordatum]|uniref:Transmembrane protein n=1 Tax=Prorocentrum cordatum TaxID=2364126 RepID=A0ABN9RZQ7_9DINO|nr:unnamed protein product [Polarella glacialis]
MKSSLCPEFRLRAVRKLVRVSGPTASTAHRAQRALTCCSTRLSAGLAFQPASANSLLPPPSKLHGRYFFRFTFAFLVCLGEPEGFLTTAAFIAFRAVFLDGALLCVSKWLTSSTQDFTSRVFGKSTKSFRFCDHSF